MTDGQIPELETRIEISNPSGISEEIEFSGLLPKAAVPYGIKSSSTAKWKDDSLRIIPKAGTTEIAIYARMENSLSIKSAPSPKNVILAQNEIIAIKADLRIRGIKVEGQAADPEAVGVPDDWRGVPSYLAKTGMGVILTPTEVEREDKRPKASTKTIAWVDFAGKEATLIQTAAVNVGAQSPNIKSWGQWDWKQARQNGKAALLAKDEDTATITMPPGNSQLELVARTKLSGWRVDVPAFLGHEAKISEAIVSVQVPPGWRVLGASGASQGSQTGWMAAFTLWEWFAIIICAWGTKEILGVRAMAAAIVALLAGRLFFGAPFGLLLVLLPFPLAIKAFPPGKFRIFLIATGWVIASAFAIQNASFTMERVQKWLHPALEDRGQPKAGPWSERRNDEARIFEQQMRITASAPGRSMERKEMPASMEMMADVAGGLMSPSEMAATRMKSKEPAAMQEEVGGAAAQAGIGEPKWEWLSAQTKAKTTNQNAIVSFWLMPPWIAQTLGIIAALLFWMWIGLWGKQMLKNHGKFKWERK